MSYGYDAGSNRITKKTSSTREDYYVRDAQSLSRQRRRNVLSLYSYDNSSFTWAEQHLYGSSRLGMVTPGLTIQSSTPLANANYNFTGAPITNGTEGKRIYELTNHLGNVMVTISDRKTGVDENGDAVIDYYKAEVLTAQDYYAFGMMMPGRTYSNAGAKYKYGFNGKENDNEVKGDGNQQDYGMRIYDPRLGRFLSVDPLAKNYPELTPYQFASNRPIDGVDLDGLEYYSAADWVKKYIADYSIQFTSSYEAPPTFKRLRQPNWKEIIGKQMYCATSTALAYAQANPKVAQVLQQTGYQTNRSLQMEYFQKGNKYASFIKPGNFNKADRGDLLFLQEPGKVGQAGTGHVAILASSTRDKGNGSFTVNVYSTNAGNSNIPDRVGTFGEAIYLFNKNDKGETQLVTKYWWDYDYKVYRSQDMRSENLILQGFGRVKEHEIMNSSTTTRNTSNNDNNAGKNNRSTNNTNSNE